MVTLQHLQRMMEAHALGPHHPKKHVAAFPASALATPNILRRVDIQAGAVVVVERTEADQLLAAAPEFDPPRLRQPLHGNLPLDPLFHVLGNIGHFVDPLFYRFQASRKKPVKPFFIHLRVLPVRCKLVPRVYGYVYHSQRP